MLFTWYSTSSSPHFGLFNAKWNTCIWFSLSQISEGLNHIFYFEDAEDTVRLVFSFSFTVNTHCPAIYTNLSLISRCYLASILTFTYVCIYIKFRPTKSSNSHEILLQMYISDNQFRSFVIFSVASRTPMQIFCYNYGTKLWIENAMLLLHACTLPMPLPNQNLFLTTRTKKALYLVLLSSALSIQLSFFSQLHWQINEWLQSTFSGGVRLQKFEWI